MDITFFLFYIGYNNFTMKKLTRLFCIIALTSSILYSGAFVQAQSTLEAVRQAGVLRCGTSAGSSGFSYMDAGVRKGFDIDFCRAIASAVLGDADAVELVATTSQERLSRLHDGDYEVLIRSTTWTFARDASDSYQINFVTPIFYDGQGLLVHARDENNRQIQSLEDFDNPLVCVVQGTTTERNLADFFALKGLPYVAVIFRSSTPLALAFQERLCDIYSADRSVLASNRSRYPNPQDFTLLDDILSKEPLAPAVREGDDQWFDVVQWVVFALIQAEEWGLTQNDVRANAESTPYVQVQYMLRGHEGTMRELGLDNDAMTRMVATVGNYGEIYNRYFGSNSITPISRGLNRLWTQGGLMYNPPFTPAD